MLFRKGWKARLALVLAVIGPGFVTANVDNDAGGIFTYSLAGAQFGYSLLWTMIPITIALVVVQEMASRMGAVTGKGLSDLIREEFGFRVTFLLMVALVVTTSGNVVAEFAGVASSLELFGISRTSSCRSRRRGVAAVVHGTYRASRRSSRGVGLLCLLHHAASSPIPIEGGGGGDGQPAVRDRHTKLRLPVHGDRPGRHDHRALDAVLSPAPIVEKGITALYRTSR